MTKDEALKMALEALEPFSTPSWAGAGVDKANEAITAIHEALAQPVQEPVAWEQFYPNIGKGPFTSPPLPVQRQPLTDEAKAIIAAAKVAMDASFETENRELDISIPAHLAAALSLRLDEFERLKDAVDAEREACAKVCWEVGVSAHHAMYAADVADLIRARGENK